MTIKMPSKEELQKTYNELGSASKIGKHYKVGTTTAWNWMKKDKIERNKSTRQISHEKKPSKEELEEKCRELGYNKTKVGKYYEVSSTTIWDWMKKDKIVEVNKMPSKEELKAKCNELKYNATKIGKYYGVSHSTAWRWMQDYGIKTSLQISKEKKPSKEELEAKFYDLGNTRKVGEYYEVSPGTAWRWMQDYGIKKNKSNVQISKEKKPLKKELKAKYKELGYNATKVGTYYEVSQRTALNWMIKYGIETQKRNSLEQQLDAYGGK